MSTDNIKLNELATNLSNALHNWQCAMRAMIQARQELMRAELDAKNTLGKLEQARREFDTFLTENMEQMKNE